MSKSKVGMEQNAGIAYSERAELNKENKKNSAKRATGPVESICGLDRGIGGGGHPVGLAFQRWDGVL